MPSSELEYCVCPYCGGGDYDRWATERGFSAVKCIDCGFIYLHPRPNEKSRHSATMMGVHGAADDMDISERHLPSKVSRYRTILQESFPDVWVRNAPLSWLDIGAGYGEVVEAVASLAPPGSVVRGLEPMLVKAKAARERGLEVVPEFIGPDTPKCEFVSFVNVFSHINDFDAFLRDVTGVLHRRGEVFIETGDMEGLLTRADFPGELGLPDHVAFAGAKHLSGFLDRNGFDIISIRRAAIDGYLYSLKNLAKWAIGRRVVLGRPYASPYRTMRVRARRRD
jgi:Zn ribbon nucleic-acid-binding protein